MKRIVVIGGGYIAGKAVRLISNTLPSTDLLWISQYSSEKYPLEILSLLIRSSAEPDQWPRIRAKIKVEFDAYQKRMNHYPKQVSKIKVNAQESEVSFLSDMGTMSYSFDRVFIFSKPEISSSFEKQDTHVWPLSSTVEYLVNNWSHIKKPVVVGSDMGLLQVLARSGKKFIWVRSENPFSEQVGYCLDRKLKQKGVTILDQDPFETWYQCLEGKALSYGPVFISDSAGLQLTNLNQFGLEEMDSHGQGPNEQDHGKQVVRVQVQDFEEWLASDFSPEKNLSQAMRIVEASLTGKGREITNRVKATLWNLGDFFAGRIRVDNQWPDGPGDMFESALLHDGLESGDNGFLIRMGMDKSNSRLVEMEAVGMYAHEWLNIGACLMNSQAEISDISDSEFTWPGLGINPLIRCSRMLKNKAQPGILGITPLELKQSADQGAEFFLMDVRSKEEFSKGRLPGSTNIPLDQLKKRVMEIPRFTPLVLYSECSARAYQGARILKGMGAKQLYVLDGGYGLYTLEKDISLVSASDRPASAGGCPAC
ncbi:rhodanese-like domain-containing protein [Desulfonatronovibrio hydrogenovorans]|uniref:rhodanese-like domain-containing protein n=1 Tax=Desulfonatronovibrio hydrogenovorans TaxID=53245 RepID=UPI00048D03CA|nr:rhodanese-like domain-containing protein [Desulfonatronovibrio hydrogenovorans]